MSSGAATTCVGSVTKITATARSAEHQLSFVEIGETITSSGTRPCGRLTRKVPPACVPRWTDV